MITSLTVIDEPDYGKAFEKIRHFIDEVTVLLHVGKMPDHPRVRGEVVTYSHSITSYRAHTTDRGEELLFAGSVAIYWRPLAPGS